jgi:hypothetical protein
MKVKCLVALGWLAFTLGATAAQASLPALAELTVIAYGAQTLDFASGRTTLLDGGEIRVAAADLSIEAPWISFLEGSEIDAQRAVLQGGLGTLTAERWHLNLSDRLLTASDGVRWVWEGVDVQAERLFFDSMENAALLFGEVMSLSPRFEAAGLWIDFAAQRLLLVGPYRYEDGLFELRGGEESALQLDLVNDEGESSFTASSTIAADLLRVVAAAEARIPIDFGP